MVFAKRMKARGIENNINSGKLSRMMGTFTVTLKTILTHIILSAPQAPKLL